MESRTYELESTSASIIFNQDMTTELMLPKVSDDEVVDFEENQNIFVAIAIASLMDDPQFRTMVGERMNHILSQADTESGCSGCCSGGCDVGCEGEDNETSD